MKSTATANKRLVYASPPSANQPEGFDGEEEPQSGVRKRRNTFCAFFPPHFLRPMKKNAEHFYGRKKRHIPP